MHVIRVISNITRLLNLLNIKIMKAAPVAEWLKTHFSLHNTLMTLRRLLIRNHR